MLEVGCPGLGEPQGSGGDELIPAPPGNSEEPPRRLGRELGRRRGVLGPVAAPAPSPAAASPSPCRGQGGTACAGGGRGNGRVCSLFLRGWAGEGSCP